MKRTESTSSAPVLKKTQPEEFDLVILGGGTGSTVAAWTFAGEGKHVAVVERKYIGGSCPNIACLPSKNIIHSAKVASYFRRSKEFGITHDGFAIDMADVRERKRRMVHALNVDGAPFKGERGRSELDLILRHAHDDEFRDCKPGHQRSHRATTGGCYENCSGPAHTLQYCCRIVDSGTNVGVSAKSCASFSLSRPCLTSTVWNPMCRANWIPR